MWHYLHDPTFCYFDTILECDGQTDTHTHRQIHDDGIYRASIASHSKNWGALGVRDTSRSLATYITIRYSAYDFLFNFNRNYVSILYCFRVIASYLSKAVNFNLPNLLLASPQGVIPFEFRRDLWRQKIL